MAKKSKKISKKRKVARFPEKIVKYLENAGIPHEVLEHRTVYTAMDAAATMRKKLGEIAKSLLVKADKDYYLIILPADQNLDFKKLAKALSQLHRKNYSVVKIPGEKIMTELLNLKDSTVSAFGQLHKLPVIAEKNLTKVKKAVFPTGNFNHSIQLAVKDFLNLEKALVGSFGVKKKIHPVKSSRKRGATKSQFNRVKLPKISKKATRKTKKAKTKKIKKKK